MSARCLRCGCLTDDEDLVDGVCVVCSTHGLAQTVVDRLAFGHVPMDQAQDALCDAVEEWHRGVHAADASLATHLGMTEEEYARWVETPSTVQDVIARRRTGSHVVGPIESLHVVNPRQKKKKP